jgi:hypothetical protein
VLGRAIGYGEIQRMITAENIMRAYGERRAAENWAAWAEEHPDDAALLNEAMLLAKAEGEWQK